MTDYEPGQRVALTPINHALFTARQGVVRVYDPGTQVVTIGWDDGTITEVRLADGDRLDILAAPKPIREAAWQQLLATVAARDDRIIHLRTLVRLWQHLPADSDTPA